MKLSHNIDQSIIIKFFVDGREISIELFINET